MKKRILFFLIIPIFILSFILLFYSFFVCPDGTFFNQCSENSPYFCSYGNLIQKASVCGCPSVSTVEGDNCVSKYEYGGKFVSLNYTIRGEKGKINFIVYEELYDYLGKISRYDNFNGNTSLLNFRLKMIDEEYQRESLLPLVLKIQEITPIKADQARIAISIVQNIPYGSSGKSTRIGSVISEYQRYPYEVLYEVEGICSEKSSLLVFLLREIGYETAFLYYPHRNHEVVGIRCSEKYSEDNSGFCFIETTGVSIISDSKVEYSDGSYLEESPILLKVSEGESLGNFIDEYYDAEVLTNIRNSITKDGKINLIEYFQFLNLKQKYGLELYY
jgi:hypothetical protein